MAMAILYGNIITIIWRQKWHGNEIITMVNNSNNGL
jgi:hypothetical protein